MPSRNSLCSCGSGKKYKKCCGLTDGITKDQLLENELQGILVRYFEDPMESLSDIDELERYEKEWEKRLKHLADHDNIQDLVLKYFLFIARRDLWRRYLLKIQNSGIRPSAKSVLESWRNPFALFGMVTSVNVTSFEVTETLGNRTYTLDRKEGLEVIEGELVFGIALPDKRVYSNGVLPLIVQTLAVEKSEQIRDVIVEMAKESEKTTSYDFFKAHLLDVYSTIYEIDFTDDNFTDLLEEAFAEIDDEVLEIVEEVLQSRKISEENIHVVQMFGEIYLMADPPNYKKPAVVAAAIVTAAVDFGIIPAFTGMSQKEIAKTFGVSVSAMMKHVEALEEVMFDLMLEEDDEFYSIGTYPQEQEKVLWELFCKDESLDSLSFENMEDDLFNLLGEPFEPKNKKEQAQLIAYEAYDEENPRIKSGLMKEVQQLDPLNIDGLLLLAEDTKDKRKVEELYKKAINIGRLHFVPEEDAWLNVLNRPYLRAIFSYGVWLFEERRLDEAVDQFRMLLQLDEDDPLYAQYLLVAAYIYLGAFDKAMHVLNMYEYYSEDEAAYKYLQWFVEEARTNGESIASEEFFDVAFDENPFVVDLIEEDIAPQPYPKRIEIEKGSIEEAVYIWSLIGRQEI